jgi:hypothetical protein
MTDRPGSAEPPSEHVLEPIVLEPVVLEPVVVEPFVVDDLPPEWPGDGLQDAVRLTHQAAREVGAGLPPDEALSESVQAFQEQRSAAQEEFAKANEWLRADDDPISTAESPASEFLSENGLPVLAAGLQTGGIAYGGLAGYVAQSLGQVLERVINAEPGRQFPDGVSGLLQIPGDAGNDPNVVAALDGVKDRVKELCFPLPVDEEPDSA